MSKSAILHSVDSDFIWQSVSSHLVGCVVDHYKTGEEMLQNYSDVVRSCTCIVQRFCERFSVSYSACGSAVYGVIKTNGWLYDSRFAVMAHTVLMAGDMLETERARTAPANRPAAPKQRRPSQGPPEELWADVRALLDELTAAKAAPGPSPTEKDSARGTLMELLKKLEEVQSTVSETHKRVNDVHSSVNNVQNDLRNTPWANNALYIPP